MDAADPYATAKANLRDTVKWMATVFAGIAAVVLAGSPFSGYGSLDPLHWRLWLASAGLAGAAWFLLKAWRIMIHLLRPDVVYESQIRPAAYVKPDNMAEEDYAEIVEIRAELMRRQTDLIPGKADTFDELLTKIQDYWKKSIDKTATEQETKRAKELWSTFRNSAALVLNYLAFYRLHYRVEQAVRPVTHAGMFALISLALFAWAANPGKDKDDKGKGITITCPAQPTCPQPPLDPSAPVFKPVLFDFNKSLLTKDGFDAVNAALKYLRDNPQAAVLLSAHTDTRGGEGLNRNLARERGLAVRERLMKEGGIAGNRIFISELPKSDLAKVTGDQVEDASNRSVDLVAVRLPGKKEGAGAPR